MVAFIAHHSRAIGGLSQLDFSASVGRERALPAHSIPSRGVAYVDDYIRVSSKTAMWHTTKYAMSCYSLTLLELLMIFLQALKLKTELNETVLTAAIESMDLAMAKEALACVQMISSDPEQVE